MHEYLAQEIFYGFSTGLGELPGFTLGLFGILLIIMISSEIIGEEYTAKTMNILRTTPISPFEILAYRYCLCNCTGFNTFRLKYISDWLIIKAKTIVITIRLRARG